MDRADDQTVGSLEISIDGTTIDSFSSSRYFGGSSTKPDFGGLPWSDSGNAFGGDPRGTYEFQIQNAGDLDPESGQAALSDDKLEDFLLVLTYEISD